MSARFNSSFSEGDAILDVQGLSVSFGALKAVDQVSFRAPRGKIVSLIGPNGAGKSTLFNLVSGAIPPTQGEVLLNGERVTALTPNQLLHKGLSRSFQITKLFFDLSVIENLRLAAQALESGRRAFQPLSRSVLARQRVDELITQFGLQEKVYELAGYLSHGEQRRLEIALAMASRPKLLLLDEPTQGMSHADTLETAGLIKSLAGDVTVLLVEHDVGLVMSLSDHVVVMTQGKKLTEGSPQDVRANPAVQSAYFGERQDA